MKDVFTVYRVVQPLYPSEMVACTTRQHAQQMADEINEKLKQIEGMRLGDLAYVGGEITVYGGRDL